MKPLTFNKEGKLERPKRRNERIKETLDYIKEDKIKKLYEQNNG